MASELSSASFQVSRSLQKQRLRSLNDDDYDDDENKPCTVSHNTETY